MSASALPRRRRPERPRRCAGSSTGPCAGRRIRARSPICWPARRSPPCSRSPAPAPGCRSRWRSRPSAGTASPCGEKSSASAPGSRWPTSPARWPATARWSAPGCSTTGSLEEMARIGGIPVVNLLSDTAHPGQARRRPPHAGGAPRRAGRRPPAGLRRRRQQRRGVAGPGRRPHRPGDGHRQPGRLRARRRRGRTGPQPRRRHRAGRPTRSTPSQAPTPSTPTCGRPWVRKTTREARLAAFAGYQINAELMAAARPDTLVLHCLPAKRGVEITDEVIDGPQLGGVDPGREPHALLPLDPRRADGRRRASGSRQAAAPAPHRPAPRGAGDLQPGPAGGAPGHRGARRSPRPRSAATWRSSARSRSASPAGRWPTPFPNWPRTGWRRRSF